MAENPESLNALVTTQNGSDNAMDALRHQVQVHDQANDHKTVLDTALNKLVSLVWHGDDKTLADLKALQAKVDQDIKRGDNLSLGSDTAQVKRTVQADQSAMQTENSIDFYGGSFLKAVPLFAGKSKLLMAASIGLNALDAVHMQDQGGQVVADLALGGLKGFALKKTFDVLGTKQLSLGAEGSTLAKVSSIGGVGLKGIAIGGLSRLYDTGLNRQNWVGANGEVDPLQAVSMATRAAIDYRSMALDAGLFMGAHGVFTGVAALGAKAVEASPLLQKFESSAVGSFIKDSKMLPGSAMGATFGFSSGAVGEVTRERQSGESLDLGKILKRGTYQALTDGAAGATGAAATRIEMQPSLANQTAPVRKMGMAFAGDDVVPPSNPTEHPAASDLSEAKPVEHPAATDLPEPKPIVHPAATDLLEAKPVEATGRTHALDEAFKPIFEEAVTLASAAVQPSASTEDVISFFKYAAGDGQHVKANMEDVAAQAKQVGNMQMEALIQHAYETTPEVASTLDSGLSLAEAASRHGATAEQERAFLDYAYGPGKGAEVPLRVAAELSGNTALDARLQEAYAGAHNLQRAPEAMAPLALGGMRPEAANLLYTILGHLPDNAESHQLFRQNLSSWLDLMPDHHDVVKQYAQQTRYGVVAAVVDAKLGTDYLSQFPDRSLTSPDLLDKLRGLDQHRNIAQTAVAADPATNSGDSHDQNTLPVQDDQAATKPNPYQPAVEHLAKGKAVNVDSLIHEFETSDGRAKQARAYLLSDFIGKMTDQQFVDWYSNGLQPAGRPDVPPETTNFGLMRMAGLDVLQRPELINSINDPQTTGIDFRTLKDFLSAPAKAASAPPAWQTGFIADRIELATQKAAMAEPVVGEDGVVQPIDPNKLVKDAVPNWFLKGIRDRASTFDRNAGTATYPTDFDDHLAQMLENQRYLERQNPKYRESTPPSNGFPDRVATLEMALDVQKTTTAPELVPQILKLGSGDQTAVRSILEKLSLETNAPEYTELLKIVVPKAENIQEVKTLLDAMYFGKKAESNAFKSRKNDRPAESAERDRDANLALALTVAQKLVPPSDADGKRVQQIVAGVINNKIRDPRPDEDGFGGPGKPGGKGGPGGGREFKQRTNPPRDDRPERDTPVKSVPPNLTSAPGAGSEAADLATSQAAPEPAPESAPEPAPATSVTGGPGDATANAGQNLNRDEAASTTVEDQHDQNQLILPIDQAAGTVVDVTKVDLAPLVGTDGKIQPVHQDGLSVTPVAQGHETDVLRVVTGTAGGGDNVDRGIDPATLRVSEPVPKPDRTRLRVYPAQADDSAEDHLDGRRISKPKGRDRGAQRERGGANTQKYQRGFEDEDDGYPPPRNTSRNRSSNRMSNFPGDDDD
jgi:hypothetical protein